MKSISHYVPSAEVKGMLRVAAGLFNYEALDVARVMIIHAIADELAAGDAAAGRPDPSASFRYYVSAPEMTALVGAFIQAARVAWMRDPS